MVRRATLALLAAIFFCTSLPQARQALTSENWLRVVREHKPGAWDDSMRAVATLRAPDFHQLSLVLQPLLSDSPTQQSSDRHAILLRGAVLHSDSAMLGSYRQGPATPGEAYVITSRDGHNTGQQASDPAWAFARRLLEAISSDPEATRIVRLWYLATTAHMASAGNLADAEHQLEDARRTFPRDADVLCDSGWYFEELASPRVQAVIEELKPPPGSRTQLRSGYPDVQDALKTAESYYTKAIDADPSHVVARIRRGRVRTLRGHWKEAIEDLTGAPTPTDRVLYYYAQLFLGSAYEGAGQLALARAAYQRASAAFPLAQSPHLGLSLISTRRGDMFGAQRELRAVLQLSPIGIHRPDPWWWYQLGSGRHAEERIRTLYAALPPLQGSGS